MPALELACDDERWFRFSCRLILNQPGLPCTRGQRGSARRGPQRSGSGSKIALCGRLGADFSGASRLTERTPATPPGLARPVRVLRRPPAPHMAWGAAGTAAPHASAPRL